MRIDDSAIIVADFPITAVDTEEHAFVGQADMVFRVKHLGIDRAWLDRELHMKCEALVLRLMSEQVANLVREHVRLAIESERQRVYGAIQAASPETGEALVAMLKLSDPEHPAAQAAMPLRKIDNA